MRNGRWTYPFSSRHAIAAGCWRYRCAAMLLQQEVNLEAIVVDETSTDEMPAVLVALEDPRVRVIRHETVQGLPAARNRGADERTSCRW